MLSPRPSGAPSGASREELFPGEVVSREAFYRSSCHKYPTTVSLPVFISLYLSLNGLQQQMQKHLYLLLHLVHT